MLGRISRFWFLDAAVFTFCLLCHGQPTTSLGPGELQQLDFPFYSEIDGFTSTLMVNNNGTADALITPTFYNLRGDALSSPPFWVSVESPVRLPVRSLLGAALSSFAAGNVRLSYSGTPMQITGQITISAPSRRIVFESRMAMDAVSNRMDAILWRPSSKASFLLALTNVAGETITVDITGVGLPASRRLSLGPRETRLVDIDAAIPPKAGASLLLSLRHSGRPGDLAPFGGVFDDKTGYSSTIGFVDTGTYVSNTLAGAHFLFGRPPLENGFPEGTVFRPVLVLANTGVSSSSAEVAVDYTVQGNTSHVVVAQPTLSPGEVREIDLAQALGGLGLTGSLDDAGVDINYSGAPGSLIAFLTSVDQTGDFAADTPMKDPLAGTARSSGSHPWRLDGGYRSVLHLKNITGRETFGMAVLRFAGGQYTLPRIRFSPYQTVAIDIGEVVRANIEDLDGNRVPQTLWGKVVWYEEEGFSLIGRVETFHPAEGVASSFSCFYPCNCNPNWFSPNLSDTYLFPSYFVLPVGVTDFLASRQKRYDCNNYFLGTYDVTSSTIFSSQNTAIATVSGTTLRGVAPGSTTAFGQVSRNTVTPPMCPMSSLVQPPGPVLVVQLSCPASVTRGATATCTVAGPTASQVTKWEFTGGGATVTASGGTTSWSGTMVQSGTISVTATNGSATRSASRAITVNSRTGWKLSAKSPTKVPNGTFTTLPTPPTPAHTLGTGQYLFSWTLTDPLSIGSGPNKGFSYYTANVNLTMEVFRYQINPDLENSQSSFSLHQYGACEYISHQNLLNNVTKHESGSAPTKSHYSQYVSSLDVNNPGLYVEGRVAMPGDNLANFISATRSEIQNKYNRILADIQVEPLYLVNQDQVTGQFQGNINYSPYGSCPP